MSPIYKPKRWKQIDWHKPDRKTDNFKLWRTQYWETNLTGTITKLRIVPWIIIVVRLNKPHHWIVNDLKSKRTQTGTALNVTAAKKLTKRLANKQLRLSW